MALRFAVTGETNYTHIVTMQEAGDHIDLHIPDTEDSAPDRKLRELLSDETFGNEPQEDAKPEKEEEEGPQA